MTLASLHSFITSPADMVTRTYDLGYMRGPNRTMKAFKQLGFSCAELLVSADQLRAQLNNVYNIMIERDDLIRFVGEWYTWYHITEGSIRRWKYRKGKKGYRPWRREIPKAFLQGLTNTGR